MGSHYDQKLGALGVLIFTLNSCMYLISCTYVQKMTETSLGLELELL